MRKKSTRLLSAALAACMMLSVLPVGAFAAEVGAADPAAAVSEQEAATSHRLNGGEIIDEDFVVANGAVYTLSGNYSRGISITTSKNITINIDDEVTITGVAKFLDVTGTGKVTINGTKDGADQKIKMTTNSEEVGGGTGIVYLDAAGADVTCNGGDYYSVETSNVGSTYSVFCVKDGSLKLNKVIAEAGKSTGVVDCGVYTTSSLATVEIQGGTFKAAGDNSRVIHCGNKGTMTINNATLEMHNGGSYVLAASGSSAELKIYNSTVVGENENSCVTVQHRGSFWAENCEFTSVGNRNYKGGLLYMLNGEATIKDSNYVAEQNGVTGILAEYLTVPGLNGPHKLTVENTKIKGCKEAFNLEYDPEGSDIKLKNVTFENNETDIYLKNDSSTPANAPQVELDEGTKDTAGAITVEVENPANGVQITTKTTGKDYQQNLKLTSKNDGWLIGYKKDADGEYRYLTQREGDNYFGLNTINATATTGEGDNATTLEPYAQLTEGTPVKLTADIPEGKKFTRWKVERIAAEGVNEVQGVLVPDSENPETATLTMPDYDIFVTAEYEDEIIVDPGTGDDAAGNIQGALSVVVIGAAAGVIAYEAGTGIYRVINMPGIPMPSNRIELAELLWEHAGKPEPVSTALYSDIDEGDTDAQKAAHWAVEQDLMKDDADNNKFNPYFPVSKLRTCLTWNAAKEKGLFDTDKTAE